jgi:SAM-dependent methyltransferase
MLHSQLGNKLIGKLLKQCRKPEGLFGALLARGMNMGHSGFTDWGLNHLSIGGDFIILDVGCGGGRTVRKMAMKAAGGKVFGLDYSGTSVAASRRTNRHLIREGRVEILQGSVSGLPFPGGMFDLVTAVETHYFWPDLPSDMREIIRVLKPRGTLVIMGEAYQGGKFDERNRKFIEMGDMTCHSTDELCKIFSAAGYTHVQIFEEYNKGWFCCTGKKPLEILSLPSHKLFHNAN